MQYYLIMTTLSTSSDDLEPVSPHMSPHVRQYEYHETQLARLIQYVKVGPYCSSTCINSTVLYTETVYSCTVLCVHGNSVLDLVLLYTDHSVNVQ